jgi:hypothetical protein
MSRKPSSGFQTEISPQDVDSNEPVLELLFPDMPVVSFAGLVVETQDANVVDNQGKPILEMVIAASNRFGQPPDSSIDDDALRERHPALLHLDCIHLSPPPR